MSHDTDEIDRALLAALRHIPTVAGREQAVIENLQRKDALFANNPAPDASQPMAPNGISRSFTIVR